MMTKRPIWVTKVAIGALYTLALGFGIIDAGTRLVEGRQSKPPDVISATPKSEGSDTGRFDFVWRMSSFLTSEKDPFRLGHTSLGDDRERATPGGIAFRYLQLRNEKGEIPNDGLLKA